MKNPLPFFLFPAPAGVLFVFLSVAAASEPADPGPQNVFQQAVQYKNSGQIDQAEELLKQVIQETPSNAQAHFELSNIYALRYDDLFHSHQREQAGLMLERAGRELEQAVMFEPGFLAAHFNLGVVYKKEGRYEEAREVFKRVLQIDPNQTAALMQIGSIYEEQGFFEEAEGAYQQAREKDPMNPEIQETLKELGERKIKYDEERRNENLSPLNQMMQSQQLSPYQMARYGAEGNLQNPQSAGAGLQQAIPYLGSMLLQQFMKSRSKGQS